MGGFRSGLTRVESWSVGFTRTPKTPLFPVSVFPSRPFKFRHSWDRSLTLAEDARCVSQEGFPRVGVQFAAGVWRDRRPGKTRTRTDSTTERDEATWGSSTMSPGITLGAGPIRALERLPDEPSQSFSGLDLPVLIRLPSVRLPAAPRMASAAASTRFHSRTGHRPFASGRRRLRREWRLAGSVLTLALPLALTALLLRTAPATGRASDGPRADPAVLHANPPGVTLAVESVTPAGLVPAAPVVLPGYLLPDDGAEEPVHAGG